ncbi:MAG: hypothetical protein JWP09_706 [Candidatus Taylorbacteria bacterium]|nr:hypothetical protein [Candidatus Taylorbacteria bacterium]
MQIKNKKTQQKLILERVKIENKCNKPKFDLFTCHSRGFSLIELIITVSIMLIVTSAVLFRQSKFSSDVLITDVAYEVALSVRDAAVSGLSSKASSTIPYKSGYGVHFEPGTDGGNPNSFINFVDVSETPILDPVTDDSKIFDYYYTAQSDQNQTGGVDSVDKVIQLTQGQTIKQYCAKADGGWVCGPDSSGHVLNIVYVRPNPDAHITMGTKTGGPDGIKTYSEAKIVVQSGLGDKCRTVSVSVSGQISVDPIDPNDTSGGCADIATGL